MDYFCRVKVLEAIQWPRVTRTRSFIYELEYYGIWQARHSCGDLESKWSLEQVKLEGGEFVLRLRRKEPKVHKEPKGPKDKHGKKR